MRTGPTYGFILLLFLAAPWELAHAEASLDPGRGQLTPPLQFQSEVIRLSVGQDSIEIDGTYRLLVGSVRIREVTLFYPYPADSLMGGARMVRLEGRAGAGPWRPLRFEEAPEFSGARWWIPLDLGDSLEVHGIYRQQRRTDYARYILTTTKAWGRPLKSARFEIRLPDGSGLTECSYPLVRQGPAPGSLYLYQAVDFQPERDLIVRWARREPEPSRGED